MAPRSHQRLFSLRKQRLGEKSSISQAQPRSRQTAEQQPTHIQHHQHQFECVCERMCVFEVCEVALKSVCVLKPSSSQKFQGNPFYCRSPDGKEIPVQKPSTARWLALHTLTDCTSLSTIFSTSLFQPSTSICLPFFCSHFSFA